MHSDSPDWPVLAVKLANRMGGVRCLHPQVQRFLKSENCRRVLIAVSGGADSVCLLALLWAVREELGLELVVGHYNHGWRAEASQEDAKFVEALADSLGCAFLTERCMDESVAATETTARDYRLEFLRRIAGQLDCAGIAFGHQANDILETQLLRLARGSGTEGLAAPRPVHCFSDGLTHLRPLLAISSVSICQSMESLGLPWRDDASNQNTQIARNALRHEVVPILTKSVDRDLLAGSIRSQRLLEEDAIALRLLAEEQFPNAFSGEDYLDRPALCLAPVALARRALFAWLAVHGLMQSMSAPSMDLLLDSIRRKGVPVRHSVQDVFIVSDDLFVRIEEEVESTPIEGLVSVSDGDQRILPSGATLALRQVEVDSTLRSRLNNRSINPQEEAFIASEEDSRLSIRAWQPGDRFRPLGSPGEKKLKDWFIDRRIPRRERRNLPVVIGSHGEVVWVPGFPPADSCKILKNTKQALRLTYQQSKPT